jgi:hypothetical protein
MGTKVRFEGFGRRSGQNGPRERARSAAKQNKTSRRAEQARIEGFGLLSGQNGAPERERSTEAQPTEKGAQKTKEQLGKPAFKDFGGSLAKTGHQKEQGASKERSQADQEQKSRGSPFWRIWAAERPKGNARKSKEHS